MVRKTRDAHPCTKIGGVPPPPGGGVLPTNPSFGMTMSFMKKILKSAFFVAHDSNESRHMFIKNLAWDNDQNSLRQKDNN